VVLECLSCGQADGATHRQLIGDIVDGQPLLWCTDASRDTGTEHKGVKWLQLLFFAFGTNVPVILLIKAVKLRDLCIIRSQCTRDFVLKAIGNRPAQEVRPGLNALIC